LPAFASLSFRGKGSEEGSSSGGANVQKEKKHFKKKEGKQRSVRPPFPTIIFVVRRDLKEISLKTTPPSPKSQTKKRRQKIVWTGGLLWEKTQPQQQQRKRD